MTKTISVGKITLFGLSNIIGALLQVWVLYIALTSLGKEHTLGVLLGDGGLFFFATSLTVSSVLILLAESPSRLSMVDIIFTLFATLGGLVTAIIVYTAVLTNNLGTAAPFHDHTGPQISCAVLALAYAFFAAGRTGYFSR